MILPRVNLDISKENFAFSASLIWNGLVNKLLDKCFPNEIGIMIPGSSTCSDMSAPISTIKKRSKDILFKIQKAETPGRVNEWMPDNIFIP